jgi:glycosyltransferase involved in cell wall biosynthesis
MKILHIIDERWDSGITNYALTAARGLFKRGHQVTVAAYKNKPPYEQAQRIGLPVLALHPFREWLTLYYYALRQQPDIINAHTGASHAWAAALFGQSARIVRTRADARLLTRNFLHNFEYKRTACVIVPSTRLYEDYQKQFPDIVGSCVKLILPGIDGNAAPYSPEARADLSLKIGVVGRLDPVKGHAIVLAAFASIVKNFPGLQLVIAGGEANILFDTLRRIAVERGIEKQVEWLGYVPSVVDVMRQCHVGVVASIGSEAVSRVVLEWMAAGRPVIATRVGGIPDLVKDGKNGLLVEPGSAGQLASALSSLLRNGEMRRAYGETGRHMAETDLSLARFVQQTEAVYEEALQHSAR